MAPTQKKGYGLDIALNRVFILGNIPLIARGRADKVVIRKLEAFDLEIFYRCRKQPKTTQNLNAFMVNLL